MEKLTTEARNPRSLGIQQGTALDFVNLMNAEDVVAVQAVEQVRHEIASAIDLLVPRLNQGGRLVYIGAGTSGRLGVLDASECPPTFGVSPDLVVGIIAGGDASLRSAQEGAEDQTQAAVQDLSSIGFAAADTLVGISASGTTPYVLAAVNHAREIGAKTIGLSCNTASPLSKAANLAITPVVGPEVIAGSTRLKAGTVTKLVLNMLSTGVMVFLGKTLGNLMVDLRAGSEKLRQRALQIVMEEGHLSEQQARAVLEQNDGNIRRALRDLRSPGENEERS